MKNIKKMSGFTLVELLIVIVIIGILATIGFVAFSGAQNAAKKSDAEATLSQVKSALGVYFAENEEYPVDTDTSSVVTMLQAQNNDATAAKLTATGAAYSYTSDGTDFTLIADGSMWGADAEEVRVTN